MRHTEVAETPCEAGDDRVPRDGRAVGVFEEVHVVLGIFNALGNERLREALIPCEDRVSDDRHSEDRHEHEQTLDQVGGANRLEAAHEGVDENNHGRDRQTDEISGLIHFAVLTVTEEGSEEFRAGAERRSGVDREEDSDDDRRDDLDNASLVAVAVLEEAGDRQRVAGDDGVFSQSGRNEIPVENGAEQQADGDPHLTRTGEIYRAGKSHKQPAAHIGSLSRESRRPAAEVSAAEEVVLVVLGSLGIHDADNDHNQHVKRQRQLSTIMLLVVIFFLL